MKYSCRRDVWRGACKTELVAYRSREAERVEAGAQEEREKQLQAAMLETEQQVPTGWLKLASEGCSHIPGKIVQVSFEDCSGFPAGFLGCVLAASALVGGTRKVVGGT
eukprot:3803679-Rhodomonas_salina.3